jgi:hypothetical protein
VRGGEGVAISEHEGMFSPAPRPLAEPFDRPLKRGWSEARRLFLGRSRVLAYLWGELPGPVYRGLLLLLVVLGCQWSLRQAWPFTIDDAGISYAYAKHIAAGDGPVAAPGGPWIEGYSNPLWVFLLVPFHWFGLPLPEVAKVLGALAFASSIASARSYLASLCRGRVWHWGAADAVFALGLAWCVEYLVWLPAGLENGLFGLLLLLVVALDARESDDASCGGASGLAACALCLTRPEGLLYVAPLFLVKAVCAVRDRAFWPQLRRVALSWMVPWFLYQALHYGVFHEWVANTYFAKPGSHDWRKGLVYLWDSANESRLGYVLPLVVVGAFGQPRKKLILIGQCAAGTAFAVYSGGDWMPYGRFLSLFIPALALLAVIGLSNLARGLGWVLRGRVPRELLVCGLGLAGLLFWWRQQESPLRKLAKNPWCHFCERVSDMTRLRQIGQRAGLGSVSVLTQDFGGPAWISDVHFYPIDFLGLCDRGLALIRRERAGAGGSMSQDFRFYEAAIHEQPEPPSWVSLPPNFWGEFDLSPEFHWGYFRLDGALLPHTRRDAFFGLHRSQLIDFFPPLASFEFRPLNEQLALVGSTTFVAPDEARATTRLITGAHLRTQVVVVPRGKLTGDEQLVLRLEAGDASLLTAPQTVGRGLAGVASQLGPGDPLRFDFELSVPPVKSTPETSFRVALGWRSGAGARRREKEWAWTTLAVLGADATLPAPERSLPRYPSVLPPPLDVELRSLAPRVVHALEQRLEFGNELPPDAALVSRLLDRGRTLDAEPTRLQAYLADVWASQVDRNVPPRVRDAIHRLRPHTTDDRFTLELALLNRFYASGAAPDQARLIGFYLSVSELLQARYFLDRAPSSPSEPELWAELEKRYAAEIASPSAAPSGSDERLTGVARDPLGTLDFESAQLTGFSGDLSVFAPRTANETDFRVDFWGAHGAQLLDSRARGLRGRGSVVSPEFDLDGTLLSLLVGGGSRRSGVRVELLVADQVVGTASGNDSDFLFPVFWDVAAYRGQRARLRVVDESTRSYVMVDRVLIWR